jgi:hypothetical protein
MTTDFQNATNVQIVSITTAHTTIFVLGFDLVVVAALGVVGVAVEFVVGVVEKGFVIEAAK